MVVDSHVHVSPVWFEPVETVIHQMDRYGVTQAVLIQILGQTDNAYQQGCLKRFPGRFASVVQVDAARDDAVSTVRRLAEDGATGLRLRPAARSPGADSLAIWRAAGEAGLAISCVGDSAGFGAPEFAELVAELPRLPIVLEHLGGRAVPDATDAERAARAKVFELARFPNVCMKVPGLGELAPRPPKMPAEGISPFGPTPQLREALKAFGPDRLMWGSDFPPVASREGYGAALDLCRAQFADLPAAARDLIFGGVARRVFRLA